MLASASADGTVRIWNVQSGAQTRVLTPDSSGQQNVIYSVAWSPDGKSLASGSDDHVVRIWDANTGALLKTIARHLAPVYCVAWRRDSRVLASGSGDQAINLCDAATGELIQTLNGHSDAIKSLAWNPDGSALASSSADNTVKIWDLEVRSWLAQAERRAGRNMNPQEWSEYVGAELPYRKTFDAFP
jgi:WD40 repeat protein